MQTESIANMVSNTDYSIGVFAFEGKKPQGSPKEANSLFNKFPNLMSIFFGDKAFYREKTAATTAVKEQPKRSFFASALESARGGFSLFSRGKKELPEIEIPESENNEPQKVESKHRQEPVSTIDDSDVQIDENLFDDVSDSDTEEEVVSEREPSQEEAATATKFDDYMLLRNGKKVYYDPKIASKHYHFTPGDKLRSNSKYEVISSKK